MSLFVGKDSSRQSTIAAMPGKSEVRFGRIGDVGHLFYGSSNSPPATLLVKFPDAPLVRLRLDSRTETTAASSSTFSSVVEMLTPTSLAGRHQALQLAAVEIGQEQFAVAARLSAPETPLSDSRNAANTSPIPGAVAPATRPYRSPPVAAATTASPPQSAGSAVVASPVVVASPDAVTDTHASPRRLFLPPIPLLTAPHFTASPAINAGPAFPDRQPRRRGRGLNSRGPAAHGRAKRMSGGG